MHTEVDVPNPTRTLMPGMYAEATLTLEDRNDAVAVPLAALDQTDGQSSVLLVDGNNRLEERRVVIGLQAAGDRVVVSDRSSLKPGIEVQPQPVQGLEYQAGKEQQ